MRKLGGYRPDPSDARDYRAREMLGVLTRVGSGDYTIPHATPVSDQGSLSSCVGNAVADALEILLELEGRKEQLSRLFVYYNARASHGEERRDGGTYIRNACHTLSSLGVCLESDWGYDASRVFDQPGPNAYVNARDRLIHGYYRIGGDVVDECASAIRANHPVVFGAIVGSEFANYRGEDRVLGVPRDHLGGHATILCGVRAGIGGEAEFLLRNSWGTGWGRAGYAWISSNFLRSSAVLDLWVLTRAL